VPGSSTVSAAGRQAPCFRHFFNALEKKVTETGGRLVLASDTGRAVARKGCSPVPSKPAYKEGRNRFSVRYISMLPGRRRCIKSTGTRSKLVEEKRMKRSLTHEAVNTKLTRREIAR
jgi:hypothetical protein